MDQTESFPPDSAKGVVFNIENISEGRLEEVTRDVWESKRGILQDQNCSLNLENNLDESVETPEGAKVSKV